MSVGQGTSLPQRAVLVPSILEGATLSEPLGAPAAAELSNELTAPAPWGSSPAPVPVSLSQRWERQLGREGQAVKPHSLSVLGSRLAPLAGTQWLLSWAEGGW